MLSHDQMMGDSREIKRQRLAHDIVSGLEEGGSVWINSILVGRHDYPGGPPLYTVFDAVRPQTSRNVLDYWQARRALTDALRDREEH